MTFNSTYIELFIRGESPGENIRIPKNTHVHIHSFFHSFINFLRNIRSLKIQSYPLRFCISVYIVCRIHYRPYIL